MTLPTWRDALHQSTIAFVATAAFPRLARWLRWPTRLKPRGLIVYIAFNTGLGFAVRTWLIPLLRQLGEERSRAEEQLRQSLGREPTEEELLAHLGIQLEQ